MSWNRRHFLAMTGMATGTALLPAPMVMAQARPRVVVIGGGTGGATVARYLAKDSEGALDVLLIEPTRRYYTCYFSNLYLGGFWNERSALHDIEPPNNKCCVRQCCVTRGIHTADVEITKRCRLVHPNVSNKVARNRNPCK